MVLWDNDNDSLDDLFGGDVSDDDNEANNNNVKEVVPETQLPFGNNEVGFGDSDNDDNNDNDVRV
ncbi:UNVERIFIED_CONTAM: hypothetical protein HDU68_001869 [Siphonaria sp. JEL0065]|nr:hypothetical protein HDU68_001869 [Siphonaria sp. JEL0065]